MILTGAEIRSAVLGGVATIDPFWPDCVNPNSYNFHLDDRLVVAHSSSGKVSSECREIRIPRGGFRLEPQRLYLGCTVERIGSTSLVTVLSGRSSMGRLGLFLNVSADLGHVGAISKWTLELTAVQPLVVYPRMKIGQVTFWQTLEPSELYAGRYQGAVGPEPNKDRSL